jgi:hypothetical protein
LYELLDPNAIHAPKTAAAKNTAAIAILITVRPFLLSALKIIFL